MPYADDYTQAKRRRARGGHRGRWERGRRSTRHRAAAPPKASGARRQGGGDCRASRRRAPGFLPAAPCGSRISGCKQQCHMQARNQLRWWRMKLADREDAPRPLPLARVPWPWCSETSLVRPTARPTGQESAFNVKNCAAQFKRTC